MQIPNIAFLSAVGVISPHRLRGGSFLFFGRICKLQFFIERKTLSWPWNWTICSKEAETRCQGSRPSCIMRRLLRHAYIFTAVGPCVCIIFNIDAYLKGIFEFPLHSRWLRCLGSILFHAPLAEWFGSLRCGFLLHRHSIVSIISQSFKEG